MDKSTLSPIPPRPHPRFHSGRCILDHPALPPRLGGKAAQTRACHTAPAAHQCRVSRHVSPVVVAVSNTHPSPMPDPDEYETGRVICEICGEGVSFRDDATGGFTLKHWEAHRAVCAASNHNNTQPESSTSAIRLPPTHPSHIPPAIMGQAPDAPQLLPMSSKRRRAKRSEEERIAYLRSDPHVAQFEAYRVLCGNCNKWIRLRPNSTYCSIPWDAHRKSCLARKGPGGRRGKKPKQTPTAAPLDPRVAYFAKDPDVRKYEGDRALCNICARWVSLVDTATAPKQVERREIDNYDDEEEDERDEGVEERMEDEDAEGDEEEQGEQEKEEQQGASRDQSREQDDVIRRWVKHKDECKASLGTSQGSTPDPKTGRRLNAEQRAAFLRADPLAARVEPNRVFCGVCAKWVQLRQDSTYCAYPWVMHRGKCVRRRERRQEREASGVGEGEGEVEVEDPESEEGVDSEDEAERERRREERRRALVERRGRKRRRGRPRKDEGGGAMAAVGVRVWKLKPGGEMELRAGEVEDPEPEQPEMGSESESEGQGGKRRRVEAPGPVPVRSLADLDSPEGRSAFVHASLAYLTATTYEATDEMTVGGLVEYLNAAVPRDKHEDFEAGEVGRWIGMGGVWEVVGEVVRARGWGDGVAGVGGQMYAGVVGQVSPSVSRAAPHTVAQPYLGEQVSHFTPAVSQEVPPATPAAAPPPGSSQPTPPATTPSEDEEDAEGEEGES
ncbi:hypothetical protein NEOLEDRAFT_1241778 [Neolentinus lepideus HHB14362 ss-1]|uniref:Uncharacterized protein n=1 Tax=Neolentinus lepideus HHB14362 ss-1 TaxID=1314782 RepID=A0A165SKD3_9AGAM|nr:hypothetical protein NEOLEDRAFT_1241778 [Neolentinus lepideus HHB14362 ss-1]